MGQISALLRDLDRRRRDLGISSRLLSKRSGVSLPTTQRILSGQQVTASFSNIVAIAEALGLHLCFDCAIDSGKMKREQAKRKAKKLVSLVQGTSGLEGQAVDRRTVESMVDQTMHELLAGSRRKLWSDE